MKFSSLLIGGVTLAVSAFTASAQNSVTYAGNGNTGFGDTLNITITSTATGNITFSSTAQGNDVVLYIDSQTGGFTSTSSFMDGTTGSTIATSGYSFDNSQNGGVTNQSLVTFAPGFTADYAISFDSNATTNTGVPTATLYSLAAGGNGSLTVLANSPAGTFNSITFPVSLLGLSLTSTASLNFDATLVSDTAYRSNEAVGASDATSSNPGFNGELTFTAADTFADDIPTAAAPEPSTWVMGGLGIVFLGYVYSQRRLRA